MKLTMKGSMLVAACALATVGLAQSNDVRVMVNGKPIQFIGAQPREVDGRVLVPLRGVFEKLGAWVNWNAADRSIYASRGSNEVRLRIGDRMATINGDQMPMDVPAQVIDGSSMVPLRFLSEALGADVKWDAGQQIVALRLDDASGIDRNTDRGSAAEHFNDRPVEHRAFATIERNTVIPIKLTRSLSSDNNEKGDRFTGVVSSEDEAYRALPRGTKIEGHVEKARAVDGDEPGILVLKFDRIVMPDGTSQPLDATLISMDDKGISRDNKGRLVANPKPEDNRGKYAAYGAGAGLIVGLISKRPVENSLIGGLIGLAVGSAEKPKMKAANVTLKSGSELGVLLMDDLKIVR